MTEINRQDMNFAVRPCLFQPSSSSPPIPNVVGVGYMNSSSPFDMVFPKTISYLRI